MGKDLQSFLSPSKGYKLQETYYKHKYKDCSCKEFDLEQEKKVQLNE